MITCGQIVMKIIYCTMIKKEDLIYESPDIYVVGTISEGVLCASSELDEWFEDDLDW